MYVQCMCICIPVYVFPFRYKEELRKTQRLSAKKAAVLGFSRFLTQFSFYLTYACAYWYEV